MEYNNHVLATATNARYPGIKCISIAQLSMVCEAAPLKVQVNT